MFYNKDYLYKVCSLVKIKNLRGKTSLNRKESLLALVSIDICGPIAASRDKERYFLILVDNYSRKTWGYPMIARDEAPKWMNYWKQKAELKTGLRIQAVKSDNAREIIKVL